MRRASGLLRHFLEWRDIGAKTPAQLVAMCLTRIREADAELKAWVEVAPQPALGDGPLKGIPFGAKDIFETRDLATEFGAPVYAGRRGATDAALVIQLRRLGAVLLGKTQTTAFAYFDPAPTRNPHDIRHTPGGSSSGSAAAVAAGMVPFALGTQTQGSLIRPASFCGIVAWKPTYGTLPLDAVLPLAPSLDTAGLFTQTADDMRLLWERMGFPVSAGAAKQLGVPASACEETEKEMRKVFKACVARLREASFSVATVRLPGEFAKALDAVRLINDYEGARTHQQRWEQFGDRLGERLADLVRRGLAVPEADYRAALETLRRVREQLRPVFQKCPVLVMPAAVGSAPRGLESTGDPRMNAPWTGLGAPAISVPMPVEFELPMGMQLVADAGNDAMLLDTAVTVEESLN